MKDAPAPEKRNRGKLVLVLRFIYLFPRFNGTPRVEHPFSAVLFVLFFPLLLFYGCFVASGRCILSLVATQKVSAIILPATDWAFARLQVFAVSCKISGRNTKGVSHLALPPIFDSHPSSVCACLRTLLPCRVPKRPLYGSIATLSCKNSAERTRGSSIFMRATSVGVESLL